ncbi:MAG: MBL fold metallo-hydrolase [Gammaproteobacteria bacterium]|nr:MBL fold metallo-hydrolase [Gammaproteobacteria bacterium]
MRRKTIRTFLKTYRHSLTITLILLIAASLLGSGCATTSTAPYQTYHPELEYLKSLHQAGPVADPQLVAFLMQQFMNANQLQSGIAFFESLLQKQKAQLSSEQEALYLAALGVLRASHATQVPLLKRIAWVSETIEMLENARTLTNNESFLVRWMTGVVHAQLPDRFNKTDAAFADLKWCVDNVSKAPHSGWLREVFYHLAVLHKRTNDQKQAQDYLQLSGYDSFDKKITLTTPYAVNAAKGHTFYPKRLREIVPGKIFNLSGFDFTEYYFVVSKDGKELISIDAGTRPDSAQAAYQFLLNRFHDLPPLTTVFVTHAHWDHIGGHSYFRHLDPQVKFYTRDNYRKELEIITKGTRGFTFTYFFGTDFKEEFISDFKPDIAVGQRTEVTVGGTRFELIPVPGGETIDGMFIHAPEHGALFVGDFIMPYIGAPFFEEGNIPGLFEAIDVVLSLNPKHLLHGHESLTRIWNSPALLAKLKSHLEWLYQETLKGIWKWRDRAAIHHQNLMPPFVHQNPEVQLPFLIMRENVINRIYDQNVGYWQPDLQGMDHLSQEEFGSLLTRYLELSEQELARAIEKMLSSGDYELGARTTTWALTQYPFNEKLQELKKIAFLKLKEKYQEFNPFKFIIYSQSIHHETPQLQQFLPDKGMEGDAP